MKLSIKLRKNRMSAQGYPLILYINTKGTRYSFYTGITVTSITHFNKGRVTKHDSLYDEKNKYLTELLSKVSLLLVHEENTETIKDRVLTLLNRKDQTKEKTLVEYITDYAKLKTGRTARLYIGTATKISKFDPNVSIQNVDKIWLNKFEQFCSTTMTTNGYAIHMRNIRTVFNYLLDSDMELKYPFRSYKIKQKATTHRALTIEQLSKLKHVDTPSFALQYRDLFMLMLYLIGINTKDLLYATRDNIINDRLEYYRFKTHKLYSIKLEPEALNVIERYKGVSYLINPMDTYKDHMNWLQHMNKGLKKLGAKYNNKRYDTSTVICDKLSTYWARHTWASIAFDLEIPKDIISLALGHSNGLSVTDIYIKHDRQKIDRANRKVIDFINTL